jgi:hypothetical protein
MAVSMIAMENERSSLEERESTSSLASVELLDSCWSCLCMRSCSEAAPVNERGPLEEGRLSSLSDADLFDSC